MEQIKQGADGAGVQARVEVKCPFCGAVITATAYFCPNCGKKVREKPLDTGAGKQLLIYAVSTLLPPLGLMWTFKYLAAEDAKTKRIGWVSAIITVVAVAVGVGAAIRIINYVNTEVNSQVNQYLMQMGY